MEEKEQYRIVLITYVVGIGLTLLVDYAVKSLPSMGSTVGAIKITTVITLWWSFYFYFGWRLPIVNRLLYRKDFNGTWFGTYDSVSKTDEEYTGAISIRIHQTWLSIGLISMTEHYDNFSYTEIAKHDTKSNTFGISYTYSQRENNLFDVAQRNGNAELTLKSINGNDWLEGPFWTIHGTSGTLKVRKISKKQIDTFPEAAALASEAES